MPLVITTLVLAALGGALLWRGHRPEHWDKPIIRRTGYVAGLAAFGVFILGVWASFATEESEFARAVLSDWFNS